jgi:hypothetical protein
MNDKIQFGIDYLHMATMMQLIGNKENPNAFAIARVLLTVEWGFTSTENDEVTGQYLKNAKTNSPEDFVKAAQRLIEYVKEESDAKAKLITDAIALAEEEHPSELKMGFIYMLRDELGFSSTELKEFMDRGADIWTIFTYIFGKISLRGNEA